MSSIFGNKFKISIFGESHGKAIGVVLDGLPAGIELDMDFIKGELSRRQPGKSIFSTPRKEKDDFEILSGYFCGRTTGSLSAVIFNRDISHGIMKNSNCFQGPVMLTTRVLSNMEVLMTTGVGSFFRQAYGSPSFCRAVAKQVLKMQNIIIASHIKSIHDVCDESFDSINIDEEALKELINSDFPVLDALAGQKMKELILDAKKEKDSVGGIIETIVINLEPGLGSPFFDGVESRMAHALFSIPAVKGIEFGSGFDITRLRGSQANDEFVLEGDRIVTSTNHNGGILGGITTGMPLLFRVAIKPTPSIGISQGTVDIQKMQETTIMVKGRHDPCIVPRAIPAVEAAAAVVILDLLFERDGEHGLFRGFKSADR